jgi:hypothetical protein
MHIWGVGEMVDLPISVGMVPFRAFSSNSISVMQSSMQEIPAHSHSLTLLKKRVAATKGSSAPQLSVALGFAEHCNQPSPCVEK